MFTATTSRDGASDFDVEIGENERLVCLSFVRGCIAFAWNGDHRVLHESDLIIYEMHVRGFTQNPNSAVTEHARGTFQGVVEKIPYLVDLGVTAVELMPVFQFDPQESNYWGYMPLNFLLRITPTPRGQSKSHERLPYWAARKHLPQTTRRGGRHRAVS